MSGLEVAGLVVGTVISAADALLKTYAAYEQHRDARGSELSLYVELKERVQRMRSSINRYFVGVQDETIPGDVLKQVKKEFIDIKNELVEVLQQRSNGNRLKRPSLSRHVDKLRDSNEKLRDLERQINMLGVTLAEINTLRVQLEKMLKVSPQQPEICEVVRTIYTTGDVDKVPFEAKELLDKLSGSGIPDDTRLHLSEMARKVWEDWKINYDDIEFLRKKNGDRKRIGATDVYLAHMKSRDGSNDIIMGEQMEVAVKQFVVSRSAAKEQFLQFIREVFLQKHAYHPCIVRTFGGYWPEPEEYEDDDVLEPFIVMERMSHNLHGAQENNLLKSMDSRRRILRDVAEGIAHLHNRQIVHRDIKPKNVLIRVVDGQIVGNAKVCGFGVSRRAHKTDIVGDSMQKSTGIAGTSPYMPAEAYSNMASQACKTARDIWSFGVLICEVLKPKFLEDLIDDNPRNMISGQELAEKIREKAIRIFADDNSGNVAVNCLAIDPKDRPPIDRVLKSIENDVPTYELHFMDHLSLEFRAKEVLRYVRNRFDADAQLNNMGGAVAILENEAQQESTDLYTQNVIAYCYYFGIGVARDEERAISMYQNACEAGDAMAKCCLGAVRFRARSYDEAVSLLKEAVGMGCAGAMVLLATCYQYGYGTGGIDANEAYRLVSSAAALGNEEALARLAAYSRGGIGTEQDVGKALAILNGLCASGNGWALLLLAWWYKEGRVVTPHEGKAEELLEKARERGIDGTWDTIQRIFPALN